MSELLAYSAFTEPKPGATPEQNEDRSAVRRHGSAWLAAVSDGASAALFSGHWAELILDSISPDWFGADDQLIRDVRLLGKEFDPLDGALNRDFVLEDKWAEQGSSATLAAVLVHDHDVQVLAIGDSIIGLHNSGGAKFFPLDETSEFGRHPPLISTRPGDSLKIQRCAFSASPGDVVTLSTDAVGARFVARRPTATRMKQLVEELQRGSNLRTVLDGPRGEPDALGNTTLDDDLTLVVLQFRSDAGDGQPTLWHERLRRWLMQRRDT